MTDITPEQLAKKQYEMSREYNRLCTELANLKKNKALEWLALRKDCKTNKEADMMWEASERGMRYLEIKTLLDGMSKEIGAGNSLSYSLRTTNY